MGSSEEARGHGPLPSRGLLWGQGLEEEHSQHLHRSGLPPAVAGPLRTRQYSTWVCQSGRHSAFLLDLLISAPCFSLRLMAAVALLGTLQPLPCGSRAVLAALEPGHWESPEHWATVVEWLPQKAGHPARVLAPWPCCPLQA